MKLILLSDPNSVHTIKWAQALAENGIDIIIFGLGDFTINDYDKYTNIKVITLDESISRDEGALSMH